MSHPSNSLSKERRKFTLGARSKKLKYKAGVAPEQVRARGQQVFFFSTRITAANVIRLAQDVTPDVIARQTRNALSKLVVDAAV